MQPRRNFMGQAQGQGIVAKDFYVYQEDFSSLIAGTSQQGNINIQADSDFELIKLTYAADLANAAQTDSTRVIPLVTVQITDSGSGRQLIETPMPIPNLFGTGELPFILPSARYFPKRSTITVTVSNYSSGSDYNIRLSFIGNKIYGTGQ